MLATTLLTIALASSAFAVPNTVKKGSSCDLSKATIAFPPGQIALAVPTAKYSYAAVAIGTQNYTCSSTGTYTNVGAVAELFDISCLYGTSTFDDVTDFAYTIWKLFPPAIPASTAISTVISLLHSTDTPAILGQHYYVPNPITGTGVNPKWDFTSQGVTKGNTNAYVVAAKVAGLAAPTGKQDIDWVQLRSIAGSLATDVYRTDTRGGQPDASCTPGVSKDIQVKYASKYWLLGSSA